MSRNVHICIEGILLALTMMALLISLESAPVIFFVSNHQSVQKDYIDLPGLHISQVDASNGPAAVVFISAHIVGLSALVLILPLLVLNRRRINKLGQPKIGCCLRCGYDLRASPDRCPECGLERDVEGTRPG
ncbi:MAG TPA: hypothetical protein VFW23_15925 [Tepidisphaeraceae bacterium]|nr:hypothetical protein [Tepidisphaeraceae bacterium]